MAEKPEIIEKTQMPAEWDDTFMEHWEEEMEEEEPFDEEEIDEGDFEEEEIEPFSNAYCNASCLPGALNCRPTEFFVQRWSWVPSLVPSCKGGGKGREVRAWTKAWSSEFVWVSREDVLREFRCGQQRRAAPCDSESERIFPQDTYFAKVYEVSYEECDKKKKKKRDCECCGLVQTCKERWVHIRSKADIPPLFPNQAPRPYYERCQPKLRKHCQGVASAPAVAKSPNLRGLGTPVV